MPNVWDSEIVLKNFKHKEKVPFIIYADTECIFKPIGEQQQGHVSTKAVQQHEPFSMALKCSYDDSLSGFHIYQGPNPASWFAQHLTVIAAWAQDLYENPVDMAPLTEDEKENLRDPNTCCHICGKKTTTKAQVESAGPVILRGDTAAQLTRTAISNIDIAALFPSFSIT